MVRLCRWLSLLFWGHFQVLFTVSFWDIPDEHDFVARNPVNQTGTTRDFQSPYKASDSMGSDGLPIAHTTWGYFLLMYHWSGDDRWLSGVQHQDEAGGLQDSESHSIQGEWHLQKGRCYHVFFVFTLLEPINGSVNLSKSFYLSIF